MSYDIAIICKCCEQPLKFETPQHLVASNVPFDPVTETILPRSEAKTNITFNYGKHFRVALGGEGVYSLHGKPVAETLSALREAISKLGEDVTDNYWDATEGNAKRALETLVQMAEAVGVKGYWQVLA